MTYFARKSIKTNKKPIFTPILHEKPHFYTRIPINTLVPCRIRVIIGNPSDNPQKPQIWARGPKRGGFGTQNRPKKGLFWG